MASSYIRKRERKTGTVYEAGLTLIDPVTGKRRERTQVFRTKREASTALAEWRTDAEKGLLVDRSTRTVAEFLRYWLETHIKPNKSENTYVNYGYHVNGHLIPGLGGIHLQKLSPLHVQQFYAAKRAAGTGTRTVQMCHLRLSQALKVAVQLGLVPRNVCDVVAAPKHTYKTKQIWTPDEIQRFVATAAQSHYGPIWFLIATTGMRRGEALGLRWRDVDWINTTMAIQQANVMISGRMRRSAPKGSSSRRAIPISPDIMELLREHKVRQNERRLQLGDVWADNDLVFPSEVGTPVMASNLIREYRALTERAGVPYITIHGIRHTFATLAITSGEDVKTLSDILGHSKTSITTDIYGHVMAHRKVELSHNLSRLVLGAAGLSGESVQFAGACWSRNWSAL